MFVITQDGRGVIWLGTREGLNEFDGYRFKVHRHEAADTASLPSDDVRSAVFDPFRNCLWVGTMDGLGRYDFATGRWRRHGTQEGPASDLSFQAIWYILVDSLQRVWVATASGHHYLEPGSNQFSAVNLPETVA
ncbi:MAG: hypothetical protein KDC44_20015, partial [Phaeodactylibacter sp.]|nr:hypothetical protein [Phaeodactylibacter sp.]